MKRLTSIFLVLAMLLTLAPMNIFAAETDNPAFSDMKDTDYYAKAATALEQLDILAGYPDGTFGAEKTITRAEMAAIVCRMIDKEADAEKAKGETRFDDVKSDHWASGYINVASDENIINGDGNGKFRPEDDVKYEEALKMVVCALGYADDVKSNPTDWSKPYIEIANEKGITDNLKGSKGTASTRGDVAVMSYNGLATDTENSKIPAAPVASVKAGEYKGTQKVKLTTVTKDAEIYYTTDGTTPTAKSTKYAKEISISKTSTLKAIAVKNGVVSKDVMSAEYTIKKTSSGGGGGGGGSSATYYNVTFDLNYEGSTGAPAIQTIKKGDKAVEPENPTRDNFTFVGWYKEQECINIFDFNSEIVSSNTILYAKWEEIYDIILSSSTQESYTLEAETVYFYADINSDANAIYLYDKNDTGTIIEMLDDGNYGESGDDLQGDGIYSCKIIMNEDVEKTIIYYAATDDMSMISNDLEFYIIGEFDNDELTTMQLVDNSLSEVLIASNDNNLPKNEKIQAVQEALNELASSDVTGENLIDGETIYYDEINEVFSFEYENGTCGCVIMKDLHAGEDSEANAIPQRNESSNSDSNTIDPYSKFSNMESSNAIELYSTNGSMINSVGDAVIMYGWDDPHNSDWYNYYETIRDAWNEEGLSTDLYSNPTIEDYKTALKGSELIVIAEHGSVYSHGFLWQDKTYIICTRENATKEKDKQYSADIKKKRVYRATFTDGSSAYCITPKFIEFYYGNNALNGSIVYMDNCLGFGEGQIWDYNLSFAFDEYAGADTIYGYHNSVYIAYGMLMMDDIVNELLLGKTTKVALNHAEEKYGKTDTEYANKYQPTWDTSNRVAAIPVIAGSESKVLISTDFKNGSFESNLNSWKSVGDVRVLNKLSELSPTNQNKMAILTTGIGSAENEYLQGTEGSILQQSFVVPDDVAFISFDYDVISEEPTEYINRGYNDQFIAELIDEQGNVITQVAHESIDTSEWFEIDNINFDGGDETTYHTKWKTVSFDNLDGYHGKRVTLRFRIWDVGDSIYDTAAIIDNVVVAHTSSHGGGGTSW